MRADDQLPPLAVVIPCWNAERWIAHAIQSVLDQNYPNVELIVIDDGSIDDSLQIIQSFDAPIRWQSGPNQGQSAARNRGLDIAHADYVVFLDADDYLETESLEAWARCAIESDADIVFGPFAYERNGQRLLAPPPHLPITSQNILCQWLEGWFTPPCSVLWRRSFIASIGGWNTMAIRNEDGELAIRALLHNPRIAMADRGLGIYVQHESPNRVSKRVGRSVIVSEFASLTGLWETAQARGHQGVRASFASAFYHMAYMAYAGGISGVGDKALCMARRLGLRGHIGSATHRALSTLFGLRAKLLLSGVIKGRIALRTRERRL